MKYGSRQSQQARSAAKALDGPARPTDSEGKRPEVAKSQYRATGTQAKGKGSNTGLSTNVESEYELGERLKAHGCDIYAGGPYASYGDRMAACILRNGMQAVVVGRAPAGKPETYSDCYERLYAKPLTKPEARRSAPGAAQVAGHGENAPAGAPGAATREEPDMT